MDSLVKAAQNVLLVLLEVTTVLHLQQVQVQFGVFLCKRGIRRCTPDPHSRCLTLTVAHHNSPHQYTRRQAMKGFSLLPGLVCCTNRPEVTNTTNPGAALRWQHLSARYFCADTKPPSTAHTNNTKHTKNI